MKIRLIIGSLFTLFFALNPAHAEDQVVKIGGSTTTTAVLIPHISKAQEIANVKIKLTPSSTGGGIVDLLADKIQMSMTSEPLDVALAAGRLLGADIKDEKQFQIVVLTTQEVAFVVNQKNPVSGLTWKQIAKIQTGKVTNWKEVGGSDMPIQVYTEKLGRGTRAFIVKQLMGGEEFVATAKAEDSVEFAAQRVSVDPSGFAVVGIDFARKHGLKLITTEKLRRPIGFILNRNPSDIELKLIQALKNQIAEKI